MMTRKDFEIITDGLARSRPNVMDKNDDTYQQWERDVHYIGQSLKQINPNFSPDRFRQACLEN